MCIKVDLICHLYRCAGFLSAAVIIANICIAADADLRPESATHFQHNVRPLLSKYCSECHEDNEAEGAILFLRAKTVEDIAGDRGHWSSVAEQLRNRTMPPADQDQPTEAERFQISSWIDKTLRQTACNSGQYAGSVTTRRLNRNEYDNTIRDLLGLDFDLSQRFPIDGSGGEGFDNNGETLFLPPLLLERYLEAATEAIDACIITPRKRLFLRPRDLKLNGIQQDEIDNGILSVGPKAVVSQVVRILQDGGYTVRLHANVSDKVEASVELAVDGLHASTFRFSSANKSETTKSDVADMQLLTKLRLTRGFHTLSLKCAGKEAFDLVRLDVAEEQIEPTAEQKERHRRIVGLTAGNKVKEPQAAAKNAIRALAEKAFRRPVINDELNPYLRLFDRALERGDSFEHSLRQALRAVLVSPHFVFRIERPPKSTRPEPVSDYELATRLSYFLWSSMPDDRLFRLASEKKLHRDEILAAEVERMLRDERAEAFYYEFVGQWLGTIEVAASVIPDTGRFKGQFSTELLMDFRDEPVRLFQYIVNEDRSVLELIDPRYAVVNERLSKHYQLNGELPARRSNRNPWSKSPKRSHAGTFERFNLKDDRRGGVLGMGGVHLLTSYPTRTSPVLRGGWVLERLLGVRVPSPPPDIPELKTTKDKKKLTAKESLALHRDNAACAACHNLMDPIGFALENYDVLGRWRDKDNKEEIDASVLLPSGEKFTGLAGLRNTLSDRKADFVRILTEKMLGYALGRSLEDRDDCSIQQIADNVRQGDYRASVLIKAVALSIPFRNHQLSEEQTGDL